MKKTKILHAIIARLHYILLAIFAAVYHHGVPARCMPPAETLQIWEAYF